MYHINLSMILLAAVSLLVVTILTVVSVLLYLKDKVRQ